jgi:hypothetical protein
VEREGFEPPVPFGTPVFKTGALNQLCHLSKLVIPIGFEPMTYSLEVNCSIPAELRNRLSQRQESNLQPADYKSAALPVELLGR